MNKQCSRLFSHTMSTFYIQLIRKKKTTVLEALSKVVEDTTNQQDWTSKKGVKIHKVIIVLVPDFKDT